MTRRLNLDLITDMWDDLLRVAASVQGGHATAAPVVGKLCSSKLQQNALTSAIKEYRALRRTVYAARDLADETYRRRIARQLNKGENLHALRRSLAYAGEGALRRRHHEQQTEQMGASPSRPTRSSAGPLSTTASAWQPCAGPAATSMTRSWRTSGRPAMRTWTSMAPTPSTSTASSPSSAPTAAGRCDLPRPPR
ncbi:Tn3 family transposase [Frankia sp. AgB1.8]|nr:Tn3 family transposase [Frankia sp. AgB1.8]